MVQQSLALITANGVVGVGGGGSAYAVFAKARRSAAARTKTLSSCYDGEEYSDDPISSTSQTITTELFYDSACTEPENLSQFTVTTTSANSASLTGTVTLYTTSGVVDGYDTITASLSFAAAASTFVLSESEATSPSASPFVNLGAGCSVAQTGNATCSVAVDDHVAALNEDNAVVENVSVSLTSAPTVSETFSGTGSAYVGGLNSTTVNQQGAYSWVVTGGSPVDTASLSASYGLNGSFLTQTATLTITDSANGGSVSVTYNPTSQSYSGTLSQTSTGATLATFNVDATGAGAVTYSDGSSDSVANYMISS